MSRVSFSLGMAAAVAVLVAAGAADAKNYRIAFLAASSQGGFGQAIYNGIKQEASQRGNVDVEIFDGEYNAAHQYSQVEDLVASKKFDGFIITPNDNVGIAPAITEATKAGLKVATTLFPIGPRLDTLEPQVPGLTVTVASDPAIGAKLQADGVVKFCADKNPCNVVIMIGQKIYPFDNLRLKTYTDTLAGHDNIKIVATVEGNYDPDTSLKAMQNVLQAHKDLNVILSNADQHLMGAEIALDDAGIPIEPLYLSGGGASEVAVERVKAGKWDVTLANFPTQMGIKALDAIVDSLEGKTVPTVIDSDKIGPVPVMVDKAVLDANPSFKGDWKG